jgi:hypothetical protein
LEKCLGGNRTGSGQVTDPRNFRLLRLGGNAKRKEHGAERKDGDFSLHVFLCLVSLDT